MAKTRVLHMSKKEGLHGQELSSGSLKISSVKNLAGTGHLGDSVS